MPDQPPSRPEGSVGRSRVRAAPNRYGLPEALLGLAAGFVLSLVAVTAYSAAAHVPNGRITLGENIVSLVGLWVGFVGGAFAASRLHGTHDLVADFGLRLRPWPDLPLGIVAGIGSQFVLAPLLELPLRPFVHHLDQRLARPAHQVLGPATGSGTTGLVVIALLVCLGSPIVEELFFRGLVLRGLLGRLDPLGRRIGPALSIVVTGLVFALVHFETVQFLGLAGFGVVLGLLAWRTGRLGPSVVAHVAFNTTTVIAYVVWTR